jgi:hypothetical protein
LLLGFGLGGPSRDEFFSVAADYILRHTRYQRADRFDPLGQLCEKSSTGEKRTQVITGAIIMLIGVIIGFGMGRSTPEN